MTRSGTVAAVLVAFFVLGAYAVVTQSLLVREFLVVFFGNELSWGLTFFGWLAGVGLGAAVGGRVSRSERARLTAFLLALVLLALLSPVAIVFIRVVRGALHVGAGEYLPLTTMLWLNPLLTVPVSFFVGFAFPLASSLIAVPPHPPAPPERRRGREGRGEGVRGHVPEVPLTLSLSRGERECGAGAASAADPIAKVYIVEALGSLVGGALFSFVLIGLFPSLFLAMLMGLVLLIGAQVLNLPRVWPGTARRLVVPLAVAAFIPLLVFQREIDRWSINRRWRSFHTGTVIVPPSPVDSRYQNITLGRRENEYTVFLDGLAAMTFPDPRDLAVDAHFVMSQAKSVRRVLVIGGGVQGLLAEMLTYPPEQLERLDYVMLDPRLLELVRPHLAGRDRATLEDERLHIHYDDGRRFLLTARDRAWDLILLEMPEPSSLLLNRFYTREFFELVASRLADDGLVTFTLDLRSDPNYLTDLQRRYLGSIVGPLDEVFPQHLATWGIRMSVLAAKHDGVLSTDFNVLRGRWVARAPRTDARYALMVDGGDDRLDPEKLDRMRRELDRARTLAPPNTDDRPGSYLYHLILWDRITHESFLPMLEGVGLSRVLVVVAGVFGAWVLVARLLLRRSHVESATLFSVAGTGFTTMSVELVLLVVFQSLFGYVYERVGIIVGVFMLGLVTGTLVMRRVVRRRPASGARTLCAFDAGLALFVAALPALCAGLTRLAAGTAGTAWTLEWGVMALVLLSGLAGGAIYPVAANVLVAAKRHTGRAAGSIDAADHAGACIGALVTGVVLLPALGITATCLALAVLKLLSAGGLLVARLRTPAP